HEGPPPVRGVKKPAEAPPAPPKPKPKDKPVIPEGKTIPEIPKPSWDAPPPVRRKELITETPAPAPDHEVEAGDDQPAGGQAEWRKKVRKESSDEHPGGHVGRRRAVGVIIVLLLLILAAGGGVAMYLFKTQQDVEEQAVKDAFDEYKKESFRPAADRFHDLAE